MNTPRRWLRFSLRTLFVLVTVFAVSLGMALMLAIGQRDRVERVNEGRKNRYFEQMRQYQERAEAAATQDEQP